MSHLPLLVVEHEAECPPGWMGEWLEAAGVVLDVRRPYAGQELPGDLTAHSGLLVLGGAMGAEDDATHVWLAPTKDLIRAAVATDVPTLGICLGHQLCAVALGGSSRPNPRGQQIGVLDVGWTDAADTDRLVRHLPRPSGGVQWNDDIVPELPDGAVVLAQTPAGELQAARFAPTVWGVQWHPEIGPDIVAAWADQERDDAATRGIDLDAYVRDVVHATPRLRATWSLLAESFADLTRDRVREAS